MDKKQYDSIQVLRALAAICIVLCHVEGSIGGQFGVDFFMCITGFIIAYTTESTYDARKFLKNRAIRILPLYYIITLFTYVCASIMPSMFYTTVATVPALVKSLCFIPYSSQGYILPVFPIGWTLNYEVGFYILFAFMIKFFQRNKVQINIILFVIMACIGFVVPSNNILFQFWTSDILLEICFGLIIYLFKCKMSGYRYKITKGIQLFGVFVIFGCFSWMFWADYTQICILRSVKWGIPAAIVLFLCVVVFEDNKLFEDKPFRLFVHIGNMSFSIYMTHYFIVKGIERVLHISMQSVFGVFIIMIGTIAVSYIVYEVFEKRVTTVLKLLLN